jgi:2,5-furandicarboxylate decarboxylase 1
MALRDLREFMTVVGEMGALQHVHREVDPRFELAAIGRKLSRIHGPAVAFDNVKGYRHQVVMNVFGTTYARVAAALGCKEDDLLRVWLDRSRTFLEPRIVETGPCQENVIVGKDVRLTKIVPQIVWNSTDGGAYITFALFFNKDPQTGAGNMSIYRLMIADDNRLRVDLKTPRHGATAFHKAESMNRPLEVAMVIGADPVLYLASQAPLPYGSDELHLAGGLREEPIEVVRCKSVDLTVPATSEIVLEGRVLPHVREMEGPFGEFTGHVGPADMRPVIEVTAVTHRNEPRYLCTYEGAPPTEGTTIHSVTSSAELYHQIKQVTAPTIKDAFFPPGGCSEFHAIVSLKKESAGQAKNVILDILRNPVIKSCVVVDEDIDIRDNTQVEWAIATRVRPDRDILIIPGVAGHPLDPVQRQSDRSSKYGIDATIPFGMDFPDRAKTDEDAARLVEANWSEYFSSC